MRKLFFLSAVFICLASTSFAQQLELKIFLEGAFVKNDMRSTSYAGKKEFLANWVGTGAAVPASTVDAVEVELISSSGQRTSYRGFVLESGAVVSGSESNTLQLNGLPTGNYSIVVKHRNHLPIQSASAHNFSQDKKTVVALNSIAAVSKASAFRRLNGYAVMVAGNVIDTPSDMFQINAMDLFLIHQQLSEGKTAKSADFLYDLNFDGALNEADHQILKANNTELFNTRIVQ
jgi:hypothetical protein